MIIVRVEHHGLTGIVTEIARAKIVSVQTTPSRVTANYAAVTYKGRSKPEFDFYRQNKSTTVIEHVRNLNVWHLVAKALKGMGYGEL